MSNIYVELRELRGGALSRDIAQHLFTRQLPGPALIIADNPSGLLPSICKQWLNVLQKLHKERARTLESGHKAELMRQIDYLKAWQFAARSLSNVPNADVYVAQPTQLHEVPAGCHTIYVTCQEPCSIDEILSHVRRHGLIVLYDSEIASVLCEKLKKTTTSEPGTDQ